MSMKDVYDQSDPLFRHLVAGSDMEAAQFDQVIDAARPAQPQSTAPSLSRAEQERLSAAIQHQMLCQRLGIAPDPAMALPTTEADPGARGPWGATRIGKARGEQELTDQIRKTAETIVQHAQQGDPEAQAFVAQSSRGAGTRQPSRVQDFLHRMAERADEFCEDDLMRKFVKALAAGDRAGMRAAVRPLAMEIVAG